MILVVFLVVDVVGFVLGGWLFVVGLLVFIVLDGEGEFLLGGE